MQTVMGGAGSPYIQLYAHPIRRLWDWQRAKILVKWHVVANHRLCFFAALCSIEFLACAHAEQNVAKKCAPVPSATISRHVAANGISCDLRMLQWNGNFECLIVAFSCDLIYEIVFWLYSTTFISVIYLVVTIMLIAIVEAWNENCDREGVGITDDLPCSVNFFFSFWNCYYNMSQNVCIFLL
jgi:hypothetical protein